VPDFGVLVIGGGAAGLRAAIAASQAGASVALVSKVHPLRTNSAVAAGGLNAPLGIDDSVADFVRDIIDVGDELADPAIVKNFAAEARDEIIWLDRMGAPFNRDAAGKLALRRIGANRNKRSCYVDDLTGHTVLQIVYEQFQRARIPAFFDCFVTSLMTGNGASLGATAINLRTGTLESLTGRTIILATGGFTRLYAPSTASIGTTGDGHSLAYSAGARLMDMEMVQFHPTVFPGGPGLLITEAALAEGGRIVDQNDKEIIQAKFEPREKLSRSIYQAVHNSSGSAFLDLRSLGKDKLPSILPQTNELIQAVAGIDVTKQPVPIYPAAHRSIGGIETDMSGRTSLNGLFAVGECACNGLNGAGRLAGNTLTEALVFGRKTGEAAAVYARTEQRRNSMASRLADEERRLASLIDPPNANPAADSILRIHAELGKLMNGNVGLVRDGSSLQTALDRVRNLKERYGRVRLRNTSRIYNSELTSYLELGSLLNIGELVVTAALARTESRGAHYRTDFPQRSASQWNRHSIVSQVDGAPYVGTRSVSA
jgi:succinate dehydrogenase / fumarate reductase, flavoprotein subunit